jgi:hypothetical protein
MHPAPARIDIPPRPNSQASWNPAVPPPPVAGAAAGNWLADRVGVADGRAVALGVADGRAVALGVADGRAVALGVADGLPLGVVAAAVRPGDVVGEAGLVAPGDSFGSVAVGGDPAQATTEAGATMASAAKPAARSLALNRNRRL